MESEAKVSESSGGPLGSCPHLEEACLTATIPAGALGMNMASCAALPQPPAFHITRRFPTHGASLFSMGSDVMIHLQIVTKPLLSPGTGLGNGGYREET